jgi:hypothetical protein
LPENTKAETTVGTDNRNIKNIFMNQVLCLSVSWADIHPNLPKPIFKMLHMPSLIGCLLVLKIEAGISGQGFRENMYSISQFLRKLFLFEPMSKHIPACRSGFYSCNVLEPSDNF